MATEVVVPSFGLGWNSGRIAHWYTADGATVHAGSPVACIESDHVAFDVEAEAEGVLRHCEGEARRTGGDILALILAPGERLPEDFGRTTAAEPGDAPEPAFEQWEPEARGDRHPGDADAAGPTPWESPAVAEPDNGDDFDFASALPTGEQAEEETEFAAHVLPLRRHTLPAAPPIADDDSPWAPVVGDDLKVHDEWLFAAAEVEPGEPPMKAPDEDPRAYFAVAPFAAGVTRAEDIAPSSGLVEAPGARQPVAVAGAARYLRVCVDLREAHKMRGHLAREWHGVEPRDEDVLVRAAARVLAEAGRGDSIALVVPEREGERSSALGSAAALPFRAAVEALAAGWGTSPGGPHAFEIVSFDEWGLDEAVPELRDGRPLALSAGAVCQWAIVEGGAVVAAPVTTLTLAYDPAVVGAGEAAWFLARVRELVEAPYALLAA
jgi:pyruvate dehydrogenase E2 component (dihydrolipoamide acetyltransferase)